MREITVAGLPGSTELGAKSATSSTNITYAFKWSYAEFDAAEISCRGFVDQVFDAYSGIVALVAPASSRIFLSSASHSNRLTVCDSHRDLHSDAQSVRAEIEASQLR